MSARLCRLLWLRRRLCTQTSAHPHRLHRLDIERRWRPVLADIHRRLTQRLADADTCKYVLPMFPYPSGNLHMGHVRVYAISDVMARFYRLCGYRVIHPIGWDAFGLPAENAARQRRLSPTEWTRSNVATMRQQIEQLCISFDWEREVSTASADYYRWTQYLFVRLFERGLAYLKPGRVNWDPVDQTVLADEQVDQHGRSWRSGALVQKRFLRQWYIRTTAFSKPLVDGLADLDPHFWNEVARIQRNWIGRCDGCFVHFPLRLRAHQAVSPVPHVIHVFTEQPQAIISAPFLLVSADHWLTQSNDFTVQLTPTPSEFAAQLLASLLPPAPTGSSATKAPALDAKILRIDNVLAQNPLTKQELPIFVVQSMDEQLWRSYADTKDCRIGVADTNNVDGQFAREQRLRLQERNAPAQWSAAAAMEQLRAAGAGGDACSSKINDWLISRQRYWGTPIPIVHCAACGAVPVPLHQLPVTLPSVDDAAATANGDQPLSLAAFPHFVNTQCPKCGADARRETDTMDTFVDSSWYFLRFLDPANHQAPFDTTVANRHMPVSLYIGGIEHAVMHLYFARFMMHFLQSIGLVGCKEPFERLLTQGVVKALTYRLADGRYVPLADVDSSSGAPRCRQTGQTLTAQWEKMSKSRHNGVEPQDLIDRIGTDATRLAILSGVAPKSDRHWSEEILQGVWHWQRRVYVLVYDYAAASEQAGHASVPHSPALAERHYIPFDAAGKVDLLLGAELSAARNRVVSAVTHHLTATHVLSAAIAAMHTFTNELKKVPLPQAVRTFEFLRCLADLSIMISPFAPMFALELWSRLSECGRKSELMAATGYNWQLSVLEQRWPAVDADFKLPLRAFVGSAKEPLVIELPCNQLNCLTPHAASLLLLQHFNVLKLNKLKLTTADQLLDAQRSGLVHVAFKLFPSFKAELVVRNRSAKTAIDNVAAIDSESSGNQ